MSYKSNSSNYKTFMHTCCLCHTSLFHLSMYQMLILSLRLHAIDFVHELELNTNSSFCSRVPILPITVSP